MASAWGDSWGDAWGDSWGAIGAIVAVEPPPVVAGGGLTKSGKPQKPKRPSADDYLHPPPVVERLTVQEYLDRVRGRKPEEVPPDELETVSEFDARVEAFRDAEVQAAIDLAIKEAAERRELERLNSLRLRLLLLATP